MNWRRGAFGFLGASSFFWTGTVSPAPATAASRIAAHASPPAEHRPRRHVVPLGVRARSLHLARNAGGRRRRRDRLHHERSRRLRDLPRRPSLRRRRRPEAASVPEGARRQPVIAGQRTNYAARELAAQRNLEALAGLR